MSVEIITKEDLAAFKRELLAEIKSLLKGESSQQNLKPWLKSWEVRQLLGISPGTLQNLRINGTLRYTKVGSILYYKSEDLQHLLDGKEHAAKK